MFHMRYIQSHYHFHLLGMMKTFFLEFCFHINKLIWKLVSNVFKLSDIASFMYKQHMKQIKILKIVYWFHGLYVDDLQMRRCVLAGCII